MISYEVEFPTQKSFSLKINGCDAATGLNCKTIEAIGGDVKIQVQKQTLLMVPYNEDISPDFTLEGYKQRATEHAKEVVDKLMSAARLQTAVKSNSDSILENASQNLVANT